MKFEKFTAREKEVYRKGKIVAYYQQKRKQKQFAKKVRYGDFDPEEAFQKALERSCGTRK